MIAAGIARRQLHARKRIPRGGEGVFAVEVLPGAFRKKCRKVVVCRARVLPRLKPEIHRCGSQHSEHRAETRQSKEQPALARFLAPPVTLPEIIEVNTE